MEVIKIDDETIKITNSVTQERTVSVSDLLEKKRLLTLKSQRFEEQVLTDRSKIFNQIQEVEDLIQKAKNLGIVIPE